MAAEDRLNGLNWPCNKELLPFLVFSIELKNRNCCRSSGERSNVTVMTSKHQNGTVTSNFYAETTSNYRVWTSASIEILGGVEKWGKNESIVATVCHIMFQQNDKKI